MVMIRLSTIMFTLFSNSYENFINSLVLIRDPEHEFKFTDPDPMSSICCPTHNPKNDLPGQVYSRFVPVPGDRTVPYTKKGL
jgi:hypothetical protein